MCTLSYIEILPWKIQGQGHGWGQRSRSHNSPSIQHLSVSNQSNQPFRRYGQQSIWPWKNTSKICQSRDLGPRSWKVIQYINPDLYFLCPKYLTLAQTVLAWEAGGWINIKMSSYQYRKSHCGDKTILRPSYLHNGISYTGKMTVILNRGPKVVAEAEAEVEVADTAAEMNWKHKVTPDWVDLIKTTWPSSVVNINWSYLISRLLT